MRDLGVSTSISPSTAHQPTLDGDHAALEIHVVPLQAHGFPLAQARREDEPEERLGSLAFQRFQESFDLGDFERLGLRRADPWPIWWIGHVVIENLIPKSPVENRVDGGEEDRRPASWNCSPKATQVYLQP